MEKIIERSDRLLSLDYLRGYFILVIIIDHLSRFPSVWQLLTGKGILWATAAEGFVMISGLMIGYVRGYKNLNQPFLPIASKLIKRSLLLYVWMVIGSVIYVWLTWHLANFSAMPWYDAQVGDWSAALHQIVTMQVPHLWVHFLYLYAIYLLLSVPAVWLLRKRQPWIIVCLSVIGYIYGTTADIEWLRWQIIFFVPVIIGFYLPIIQRWWANTSRKMQFTIATYSTAIITVILSVLYVTYQNALPASATVNDIFDIYDFSPARIAVAAVWFTALVLLFNKITPWLAKHTYGVIHYFGTHSLTAYIAHGVVLCAIAILVPIKDNFFINTAAGLAAILGVYLLIRIPVVRRLLPR